VVDYKQVITDTIVENLARRTGLVAFEAVVAAIEGDEKRATKLKEKAEKLEGAAKIWAEQSANSDAPSASVDSAPVATGSVARWGAGKVESKSDAQESRQSAVGARGQPEYSVSDVCEALRDQLPAEDGRPEAQVQCLQALACITDKQYTNAATYIRAFAWMGGKASSTAGVVADCLDSFAKSA
jgi:hypothetical protein